MSYIDADEHDPKPLAILIFLVFGVLPGLLPVDIVAYSHFR
jgi:hypothetical protein